MPPFRTRILWILIAILSVVGAQSNDTEINPFTTNVNPPPQGGQPFTITWTPTTQGLVNLELNYYFAPNPNLNIVEYSQVIGANLTNSGSFVWNVPEDLLPGRYSFSIYVNVVLITSTSEIWTYSYPPGYTPSYSLTIAQTTACITPVTATPSPTGVNPFLVPNDSSDNVRSGRAYNISWAPTTSGTVTILLEPFGGPQGDTRSVTTIASNVPNSGSYSWTPDTNLASPPADADTYYFSIIDDSNSSPSQISNSTEVFIRSPGYAMTFISAPGNPPPVLGQPFNIMWDPSNATAISLVIFGGSTQGPDVNVTIADHVPNTGSFIWNVPTNQPPIQAGYWTLSIFNDDTGNKDSTREFVINAQPASTCVPGSTPTGLQYLPGFSTPSASAFPITPRTTTQAPQTTNPSYLPGSYAQALEITACATSIEPFYTEIVGVNATVTSFPLVGCQTTISASGFAGAQVSVINSCKPDFQTFAFTTSSGGVCCPTAWGTSTLGSSSVYCYTTTTPPVTSTVTNMKRRAELFPTTVVLRNIVFALAGTVTGSISSTAPTVTAAPTAGGASAAAPSTTTSSKSGSGRVEISLVVWSVTMAGIMIMFAYL